MERIPITRKGYEALKAELERIKKVDRPANIIAIEEARAHGDLSENAEYDAAKERQQFINGRISELGYKLGNADIIDLRMQQQDSALGGIGDNAHTRHPPSASAASPWASPSSTCKNARRSW